MHFQRLQTGIAGALMHEVDVLPGRDGHFGVHQAEIVGRASSDAPTHEARYLPGCATHFVQS